MVGSRNEIAEALTLPCLRLGTIDFEDRQPRSELRPALCERVESRTENYVLPNATINLFLNQILDQPRTGQDRSAKRPRKLAHVRSTAPVPFRRDQLQSHFVFEHMRRFLDLNMQLPPHRYLHLHVRSEERRVGKE